ncbi:MAG: LEA type 2 family protein [Myxococcales bacterium]|nr:LEA type 2 family protein [Myxococcales bacterium]MCB9735910.1 LEA type 2 family protein [Deltaproteobacteria bacterium]
MTLGGQLRVAFVEAPRAIFRVRGRAAALMLLYLALAGVILGGVAAAIAASEGDVRRALVAWLFPAEAQGAADFVATYLLKAQTRAVLMNLLVSASLLVVSLVLFRVKERFSAAIEAAEGLSGGRPDDGLPWWHEALEEVKLVFFYLALFFAVFAIGHDPAPWRRALSTGLSYAVMFLTFAIDFGAPTPQRHGARYGQVLRALLARPIATFGFGAVFSLPLVAIAQLAASSEGLGAGGTVAVIFGANVVGIVWGAAGGTWLGARILPVAEAIRPAPGWLRAAGWVAILAVVAGGAYVTAAIAQTVATKSQILRCSYDVDWSSLRLEKPGLGKLLGGEVDVGVGFDLTIRNPNSLAVELEENHLDVTDGDRLVATTSLAPLSVPAGGEVRTRVALTVTVNAKAFLDGASLNPAAWSLTLWVRLDGTIDYPIYLRRGGGG